MIHTEPNCPLCGAVNGCQAAQECRTPGSCWCGKVAVSKAVLGFLKAASRAPACLCQSCLTAASRHATDEQDPKRILERLRQDVEASGEWADYYYDSLGRVVFTASYHLKRGFCCGNGCRHCPYPA